MPGKDEWLERLEDERRTDDAGNFAPGLSPEKAKQLTDEFMQAREGKNMGERFALSLELPFRDQIYLVELAATRHKVEGESRRLHDEFLDFANWLSEQKGLRMMPRSQSARAIEYVTAGDATIMTRMRPLVRGVMGEYDRQVEVVLYKETTFEISSQCFEDMKLKHETDIKDEIIRKHGPILEIFGDNIPSRVTSEDAEGATRGAITDESLLTYFETLLYGPEDEDEEVVNLPSVKKYRTAYYSIARTLKDPVVPVVEGLRREPIDGIA